MINCSDAVKQLWAYLDGDIDAADKAAVEEHLDVCKRCCGEAEFAAELQRFLASHNTERLPAPTRDRLTAFIESL
ncbi:MAG: zf-HC2 domain-containing protein [Actinomycetota bacterium]|nr:zf-HC2 domain-containing protein [Actinomycetota bacterium]